MMSALADVKLELRSPAGSRLSVLCLQQAAPLGRGRVPEGHSGSYMLTGQVRSDLHWHRDTGSGLHWAWWLGWAF